jgi:hypothetical protein
VLRYNALLKAYINVPFQQNVVVTSIHSTVLQPCNEAYEVRQMHNSCAVGNKSVAGWPAICTSLYESCSGLVGYDMQAPAASLGLMSSQL